MIQYRQKESTNMVKELMNLTEEELKKRLEESIKQELKNTKK